MSIPAYIPKEYGAVDLFSLYCLLLLFLLCMSAVVRSINVWFLSQISVSVNQSVRNVLEWPKVTAIARTTNYLMSVASIRK